MPLFDTPITTDNTHLPKILKQSLPVLLYLYNRLDPQLETALKAVAREYAGKLLVARVDINQNPQVHEQYQRPTLPAIIALKNGDIQSSSASAQESDIKAHTDYLLDQGPKPTPPAAPPETARPVPVTDASFAKDVLQSKLPVLVDFWAPWCGPCHMIAPTIEKMAQKYAGRLKVAKLNVDENPQTAARYQAMSIPMLILFKGGQVINRLVGAQPPHAIESLIQAGL
jgi:thioredoxin 1